MGGSGEVVFQCSGSRERQSALKIDINAPEVCCVLIGLDVCDLRAEFEGMRAPQIRDTVLKIEIRAGAGTHGTASIWVAQAAAERPNRDIRQPTPFRYARIEGIALAPARASHATGAQTARAIGDQGRVADGGVNGKAVVAKPEFIHHSGTGRPNPVLDGRQRADNKSAPEQWIHSGVILASPKIIAGPEHAADPVLAVDGVVYFSNPIVAAIDVGECRRVVGITCIGVEDEAARAGDWPQGAAQQIQTDRAWRYAGGLQRTDRVHHAAVGGRWAKTGKRLTDQRPSYGHWKRKYVANQVAQTLI